MVSESTSVTTSGPDATMGDEEVKKAREQLRIFGELLQKCVSLEVRRRRHDGTLNTPEFEAIRKFCNQCLKDSRYLVIRRLPDDIIRIVKERKKEAESRSP